MNNFRVNLDAEFAVVGACLINDTAYWRVQEFDLTENDFTDPDCRKLWATIQRLAKEGVSCDAITIGSYDKTINIATAIHIANNTPGSSNVTAYAKLVANAALARSTLLAGQEIASLNLPGDEAAEEGMKIMQRVQVKGAAETVTLAQGAQVFLTDMQRRFESGQDIVGVSTGIAKLDAKTSGFEPGLIIIAGRPSSGKSALGLQMALSASVKRKERVFFASLEMDRGQLTMRAVSHISGVPLGHLKNPKLLDETQWPKITQAMTLAKSDLLVISDRQNQTAMQIAANIRREHLTKGLTAAYVDYLGLMRMLGKPENLRHGFGDACKILRAVAKDCGIPVILLAQLNRKGSDGAAPRRPIMTDLKESGDIEQDADMILLVHRESYYGEDGASSDGIAELIVAKQRQGATGTVPTYWRGSIQRFEPYDGPWPLQEEKQVKKGYTPYSRAR